MSHELHYTSAPRGLKPGSKGYCTVACTANLPGPLAERIESLSGYRQVFPNDHESVGLNPVAYSHVRLSSGGRDLSVISRVAWAGLDYTDRSNKYAHHVILEASERPEGGPAWLASQPGFLDETWSGEPRILPAGRSVPSGGSAASACRSWGEATGDAGWAGVVAESYLADPKRPIVWLFLPGQDLLPLFAEAIALLPPDRRWGVAFTTYLTSLPPDVSCPWRGILHDSAEAAVARRSPNSLVLDLTQPMGAAQGDELVELARTGVARPRHRMTSATPRDHAPDAGRGPTSTERAEVPPPPPPASFSRAMDHEMLGEQPTASTRPVPRPVGRSINSRASRSSLVAALAAGLLLAFAGGFLAGQFYERKQDRAQAKAEIIKSHPAEVQGEKAEDKQPVKSVPVLAPSNPTGPTPTSPAADRVATRQPADGAPASPPEGSKDRSSQADGAGKPPVKNGGEVKANEPPPEPSIAQSPTPPEAESPKPPDETDRLKAGSKQSAGAATPPAEGSEERPFTTIDFGTLPVKKSAAAQPTKNLQVGFHVKELGLFGHEDKELTESKSGRKLVVQSKAEGRELQVSWGPQSGASLAGGDKEDLGIFTVAEDQVAFAPANQGTCAEGWRALADCLLKVTGKSGEEKYVLLRKKWQVGKLELEKFQAKAGGRPTLFWKHDEDEVVSTSRQTILRSIDLNSGPRGNGFPGLRVESN